MWSQDRLKINFPSRNNIPGKYVEACSHVLLGFAYGGHDGLVVAAQTCSETCDCRNVECVHMVAHDSEIAYAHVLPLIHAVFQQGGFRGGIGSGPPEVTDGHTEERTSVIKHVKIAYACGKLGVCGSNVVSRNFYELLTIEVICFIWHFSKLKRHKAAGNIAVRHFFAYGSFRMLKNKCACFKRCSTIFVAKYKAVACGKDFFCSARCGIICAVLAVVAVYIESSSGICAFCLVLADNYCGAYCSGGIAILNVPYSEY